MCIALCELPGGDDGRESSVKSLCVELETE